MLLNAVNTLMKKEFANAAPQWRSMTQSYEDNMFLKSECKKDSEFDPFNSRKKMLDDVDKGDSMITVMGCQYGTVHVVHTLKGNIHEDIPWGLWGRILRMYSNKQNSAHDSTHDSTQNIPIKVFFLATDSLREFPKKGPITPLNINGGYTYHCNRETIMIYRAEDATRVLLHELMHACCLDRMELGIDQVEAETEAWAELMHVGFLSQGNSRRFYELLHRQADWIIRQNERVRKWIKDTKAFPWRYTVGKEEVWRRWNILGDDSASHNDNANHKPMTSLRLTCSPDSTSKKDFNVGVNSVIL